MMFLKNLLLMALVLCPAVSKAQDLTNQDLLHPSSDMWPLYHGDYTGERHTHLTQITRENVGYLSLA